MKNIVNQLEKFMPPPPAKSLKTVAGNPVNPRTPVNTTRYFTSAESGLQRYERMMQDCVRKFKCEKPRVNAEIPAYPVAVVSRGKWNGVELQNLLEMSEDDASAYCGNLQMAWLELQRRVELAARENNRGKTAGRLGACVLEKMAYVIFRGNIDVLAMREIAGLVDVKTRYLEKSRINEYILTARV